jgi:transcription termination factor Rho
MLLKEIAMQLVPIILKFYCFLLIDERPEVTDMQRSVR